MFDQNPFMRDISLTSGDTGSTFIQPSHSIKNGQRTAVVTFSVDIYDVLGSKSKTRIYFSDAEIGTILQLMNDFGIPVVETKSLGGGEFVDLRLHHDQKIDFVIEKVEKKTKRPITIVHEPGNMRDTFDFLNQAIEKVIAQGDLDRIVGMTYNGDQTKYSQFCDTLKFAIESILNERKD